MILAEVVGTVVASKNADGVDRGRYLLVQATDDSGTVTGSEPMVALDAVQADRGQLVIVAQGSSCRQIMHTKDRAVDALIVGIVDTVDVALHGKKKEGNRGYRAV